MKKVKLTVEGMHCGSCAGNVEKALKKVKGVEEVSVSMMTNKAIIQVEDDVKEEDLKAAIKEVGYEAS